jgi:hypothetical protein
MASAVMRGFAKVMRGRGGRRRAAVAGATAILACLVGGLVGSLPASAAGPVVSVFPLPGAHFAAPQSQITIRGVPASQIGPITVVGSKTGAHAGRLVGDSDGQGASFFPTVPFAAGESVTVSTGLNINGSGSGGWVFSIATPARALPVLHWPPAARQSNDVQFFHTRHDLSPVSVTITKHGATGDGDIFVAPQWGPVEDGPMILDPNGNLIWFDNMKGHKGDDSASDFRVQTYHGQPVLTWWQGTLAAGVGLGTDVIFNSAYQQIASVNAGNGLQADLHEFQLTSRGTALITSEYPVILDASSIKGASKREIVMDSVAQEIDIPTGNVLFQWDSLDHVPLSYTYTPPPHSTGSPFDYFHINSLQEDHDGNLLISGRNTWAAYKVNKHTGAVMWSLGGKHNSFKFAAGTYWAWQHDVRIRAANDAYVTIFDDEDSPKIHSESRAVRLKLDTKHMTVTTVTVHHHSPSLLTAYEGNYQQLGGGNDFIGWGQQPYFTEYDNHGRLDFDGHFNSFTASYRAYRFQWTAVPWTPPAVATARRGKTKMAVWASWNGATTVASWRVLGGSSASALHTLTTGRKSGFETGFTVAYAADVQVQALDSKGNVIKSSAVSAVH